MISWVARAENKLCERCAVEIIKFETAEFVGFHGTAKEVRQQARDGCSFCRQLVIALHLYKTVPTRGGAWDFHVGEDRTASQLQGEAEFAGSHIYSESRSNQPVEGGPVIQVCSWQQTRAGIPFPRLQRYAEFHIRSVNDDLHYFSTVLPPGMVADMTKRRDEYYRPSAIVQACLASCVSNHECRPQPHDGPLPTRIIDVGETGQDRLKLFTPGDTPVHEKYLALSYCWGLSNTFVLTSANLPQLQQGFSIASLPRTLQDAVELTRNLGIHFLWVDALCILQGSDDKAQQDWMIEFPRMGDYYGNAHFTISAAGAKDADGGLFAPQVENGHILPSVNGGHIALNPLETNPSALDQPINARGWVLQERLLSSRNLVCSILGIAWQCDGALMGKPEIAKQYRLPAPPTRPDWLKIVEDYSARSLSNPTDKLPAIASLAARYQTSTAAGDRYLAGLWQSDLLQHLLWKTQAGIKFSRPPSYRAPSWSWAAVDGPVTYRDRKDGNTEWLSQILDCQVVLTNAGNPFGSISNASLTVRGPLLQVSCHGSDRDWRYLYPMGCAPDRDHDISNDNDTSIATVDYDVESSPDALLPQFLAERALFVLLMAKDGDEALGLLQAPGTTKASITFTRFGIVNIHKLEKFTGAIMETVTVI